LLQEIGQVVKVDGRKAQVRVKPSETCAQCGRCGLAALSKQEDILMDAWNEIGAVAGDSVLIEVESKDHLTATFVVHIVPLLAGAAGYIAGAFVAYQAGLKTAAAGAAGAVFAFLLSFAGIRAYDRKSSQSGHFVPRIVENFSGAGTTIRSGPDGWQPTAPGEAEELVAWSRGGAREDAGDNRQTGPLPKGKR